jgi:DNA polymerase IV
MDAFFAAVEVLDDPRLAGLPVIVGGSGGRGVVAACTYEARSFGIHSAMSSVEARHRCPDAVFVSGRYWRYSEVSEQLHEVLQAFSPMVEGIGLDEAFVDVAGSRRLLGSPLEIAVAIRAAVRKDLELACSVGVARTKHMAKLASQRAKPIVSKGGPRPGPGVLVVAPDQELAFLHPLPVRALWGVGPATARRLDELGVTTVGELATIPEAMLCRAVGDAHGRHLASLARGEDPRRVEPLRETKSVGHEETFAVDLRDRDALHTHVVRMADAVASRLRDSSTCGRTVTIKVRYGDRATITRSHTVGAAIDSARAIAAVAGALLDAVEISSGVRLLGVAVSGIMAADGSGRQLSFDGEPADGSADGPDRAQLGPAWREVESSIDAIRARYGQTAVGPAALVGRQGLALKRRGDAQWGPEEGASEAAGGADDRPKGAR